MQARLIRSGLALTLVVAPLALTLTPSQASPGAPVGRSAAAPTVPYVLEDGKTKPIYSYENAIRESVWVKAPDGDGDGERDLVTVDIVRPTRARRRDEDPRDHRPEPVLPLLRARQRVRDGSRTTATATR